MEAKLFRAKLPRWVLVHGALLIIVLCLLAVGSSLRTPHVAATVWHVNDPASSTSTTSYCRPGPWGTLEYQRIVLEPPDEYVDLRDGVPKDSRWFFKGKFRAEIEQYLNKLDVPVSQIPATAWEEKITGTYLTPPAKVVWELSEETRSQLYGLLGETEENDPQANPYRYRADKVEEWFENAGLRPETLKMVQHLLYRNGDATAFADIGLVFPLLPDDRERVRLLKVLKRSAALQVRVHVPENMNIKPLAAYWGLGGREKDIRPILESVARRRGGGTVSIWLLLPKFARTLLDTFPLPSVNASGTVQNCHWTSLNFFHDQPDNSLMTVEGASQNIVSNYYEIVAEPQLGDILMFSAPGGGIIHSCVYIADEIVFTKNGITMSAPWVLMPMPDVLAYYKSKQEITVRIFRPKQRLG